MTAPLFPPSDAAKLAGLGLRTEQTERRPKPRSSGVRLTRSATFPCTTSSAFYTIPWQTADWDTDGYWDSGAADQITFPFDGLYLIWCYVAFAPNATGRRFVSMYDWNGTENFHEARIANATGETEFNLSSVIPAAAGDEWKIDVSQASGGSLNVDNAPRPFFGAQLLGS